MTRFVGAIFLTATVLAGSAAAQTPPNYTAKDAADALLSLKCAKGTELGPDGVCEPIVGGRGLSLPSHTSAAVPSGSASQAAASRPIRTASAPAPRAVSKSSVAPTDFLITFHLGSAELTEQGKANARSFAGGLKDPRLAGLTFEIAGHTDATGTAERNQALSQARADSVKSFLVGQGIEASRLSTHGYGAQQLAIPAAPASGANRRVEVKLAS